MDLMAAIGEALARRGWTLRSGAAEGADTAFEVGAARGGGRIELYLPWPGFHIARLKWAKEICWADELRPALVRPRIALPEPTELAIRIAAKTHPWWATMNPRHRPIHARNVHQCLGADCATPSRFVLCWTPDGAVEETSSKTGGTGQAIRVAHRSMHDIPIHNLQRPEHRAMWEQLVA